MRMRNQLFHVERAIHGYHDWKVTRTARKCWEITFLQAQLVSVSFELKQKTFDEESVSFVKSYWWFTSRSYDPWNIINYSRNHPSQRLIHFKRNDFNWNLLFAPSLSSLSSSCHSLLNLLAWNKVWRNSLLKSFFK